MTDDELTSRLVARGWPTAGVPSENLTLMKILVLGEMDIEEGRTKPIRQVIEDIKARRVLGS